MKLKGKVAVITGAGSGIGRALAVELAKKGATGLALSDVDEAGLAETAELARAAGARVHTHRLDVADRAAFLAYAEAVAAEFGVVNVVINNAGISATGNFEDLTFERFDRVMNIDFGGVLNGSKAFLPHLIASGDGHLVNISSLFGLLANPGQSPYNAAKFAVRGLTESLRQEMLISDHNVEVTCVHPGGIKTNIAKNADTGGTEAGRKQTELFEKLFLHVSPESAAKEIIKGIEKKKGRVLIGIDAKSLDALVRLSGSSYQRVQATIAGLVVPGMK
ncbi:MAG: SDR family NAD(P)-dependent oxidoreductase [Nocardiaceae bacterium]|nr:SDR family NAD(P)-dependent oxidoreductase [Nocardiaceae bacterium]